MKYSNIKEQNNLTKVCEISLKFRFLNSTNILLNTVRNLATLCQCWQQFKIDWNFDRNFEIALVQKCTNLIEFEKCCRIKSHSQKAASIQTRAIPSKMWPIYKIPPPGHHASHHRLLSFESAQSLLALLEQRALCTFFSLPPQASLHCRGLMVSSPGPCA